MNEAIDRRAELAEKHFPKQWAKLRDKHGATKARYNLKVRAARMGHMQQLRSQGKRCGNCACFKPSRIPNEMCCERDSFGWDGDLIVSAGGICTKWERAA